MPKRFRGGKRLVCGGHEKKISSNCVCVCVRSAQLKNTATYFPDGQGGLAHPPNIEDKHLKRVQWGKRLGSRGRGEEGNTSPAPHPPLCGSSSNCSSPKRNQCLICNEAGSRTVVANRLAVDLHQHVHWEQQPVQGHSLSHRGVLISGGSQSGGPQPPEDFTPEGLCRSKKQLLGKTGLAHFSSIWLF